MAARNVLLGNEYEVKVADFGMSRTLTNIQDVGVTRTNFGPLKWMAPEAILEKKYSNKSDIWGYGVVCWEVVTRNNPWQGTSNVEVAHKVVKEHLHLVVPEECDPDVATLMVDCWEYYPEDRPDAKDICRRLKKRIHEIKSAKEIEQENEEEKPKPRPQSVYGKTPGISNASVSSLT